MVKVPRVLAYPSKLYRRIYAGLIKKSINKDAKKYYRMHKNDKVAYKKNVWSRNYLWDFFFQSQPHSEKSHYYVPADYYLMELEPALNGKYDRFCSEKNYYDLIFARCSTKLAGTIMHCINGMHLDSNYSKIDDLNLFCGNIKEDIIVKPSLLWGGVGVKKYSLINGVLVNIQKQKFDISAIDREYRGNYVIQPVVAQHELLAKFHPSSVNTIRAFSYRSVSSDRVHITMAKLRMGVGGVNIDNQSAGGIACGITNNGYLMEYAFDDFGKCYTAHPDTMIEFKGCVVPGFQLVINAIPELANMLAHHRLLGWDFGIDRDSEPVLIEVNTGTGIHTLQICNGRPLFGDFSQEVLDYMRQHK